jgi:hypothetical protein
LPPEVLFAEPEKPIGAALMDELIDAPVASVAAYPIGIIVLGSKGNWLEAAAVEGESELVALSLVELSAAVLAVVPAAFAAAAVVVVEFAVTASSMLMS